MSNFKKEIKNFQVYWHHISYISKYDLGWGYLINVYHFNLIKY